MRKKLGFVVGGIALTLLLSSCWIQQSFSVVDYTVDTGQTTKAQFVLRPLDEALKTNTHQFVLIGVTNSDVIGASNAKWGTNDKFGGPLNMPASATLAGAIGTDCDSNGVNYSTITGFDFKGFVTPHAIRDRGLVESKAVAQVSLKVKAGASVGVTYTVMGISGSWVDDGDGLVNSADSFTCWGIGTSGIYVKS
jgi:hypothetical protein